MGVVYLIKHNLFFITTVTLLWRVVGSTSLEQQYCTDLKPQSGLDISQIMGMWYGEEVISHMGNDDGITIFDSCPIIHLSEITHEPSRGIHTHDDFFRPMTSTESYIRPGSLGYRWTGDQYSNYYSNREYRYLRLYWDENGRNIEYYVKFNTTRKGFWISSGPQHGMRGSMLQKQYNQFAGTIQVMKAVLDHLVLTICKRLPESALFTIVLSREPQQLTRQELHSVHNLLNRRDLQTSSVRKVCRNGTSKEKAPLTNIIMFMSISSLIYFKVLIL